MIPTIKISRTAPYKVGPVWWCKTGSSCLGASPNLVMRAAVRAVQRCTDAAASAFHQEGNYLHADMIRWGWRPNWAKDRAAPINARVEKVAHGPFFRAIWPHRQSLRSTTGSNGWARADQKNSPTSFVGVTGLPSSAPPSVNTLTPSTSPVSTTVS